MPLQSTQQKFYLDGSEHSRLHITGYLTRGIFYKSSTAHCGAVFQYKERTTVASTPWVNSTVESLNRDIIVALRAMLLDMKMAPRNCISIFYILPSVLIKAHVERHGINENGTNRTVLEFMARIFPGVP